MIRVCLSIRLSMPKANLPEIRTQSLECTIWRGGAKNPDYSQSFTEAIKEVYPHTRFQADHFHTVKNIWKHLKKSLLSYRRKIKSSGEDQKDEDLTQLAKQLWKMRWSLLKKPVNLSTEERKANECSPQQAAGYH
jgi:transposase